MYPIPTTAAMIINPAGEILLLKSLKWKGLFGFPGGKIDYGESITDALLREVKEETGLRIHNLQFFTVQELISEDKFISEQHFVSLNYICRSNVSDIHLNDEASDYLWCTPDKALAHALNRPTREMIQQYLEAPGNQAEDIVAIDDLRVHCIVGKHDHERVAEQPVLLSVELYLSTKRAAVENDLSKSANYANIALKIKKNVQEMQYYLLETMAENLAQMILTQQDTVQGVKITIKKPRGVLEGQGARVAITRYRSAG